MKGLGGGTATSASEGAKVLWGWEKYIFIQPPSLSAAGESKTSLGGKKIQVFEGGKIAVRTEGERLRSCEQGGCHEVFLEPARPFKGRLGWEENSKRGGV